MGKNCLYVIDLFKNKKYDEVVRCGFSKTDPIFCCKETAALGSRLPTACEGTRPPPDILRLDDHIVNGEKADVNEFPHMAALGYEAQSETDDYDFRCGGTLISQDFVLTAAHCANRKDVKPIVARFGKVSRLRYRQAVFLNISLPPLRPL
jgi:Trypsin